MNFHHLLSTTSENLFREQRTFILIVEHNWTKNQTLKESDIAEIIGYETGSLGVDVALHTCLA